MQQQPQVKANDEVLKGQYANAMQLGHNKTEFFIDFALIAPPVGQVVTRVITSPAHMKQMAAAISQNIKQYENTFGPIEVAPEQKELGFKTS
jgi:hypothetical protein